MTQKEKGQCNLERYEAALASAKEGKLDDIPADILTRHYSTYQKIARDYMPQLGILDTAHVGYWIYGPPGSGKTRYAHANFPGLYPKSVSNWWDGYQGETTVLIDDLDKYHVAFGYQLKIWLDRYPFIAEIKGGARKIRPTLVIITSNYTPEEIWDDPSTVAAIRRRCRFLHLPLECSPSCSISLLSAQEPSMATDMIIQNPHTLLQKKS